MRAEWHFASSLVVAFVSLLFNQSTPFFGITLFGYEFAVFFLCIVAGVFVDIDHVVDFRLNKGLMRESLASRFRNRRMFLVFHGIENVVILGGLSILFPFLIFPTISYACHMIMDVRGNGAPSRAYFYTVRFGRKLTL
jgi:hypothetical protein